jgi:hypothetical protein
MKVLFNINQGMRSGMVEAAKNKYHKHVDSDGTIWLVADGPGKGDAVYCSGGPGSQGFGGATLRFELVDGGVEMLTGPWHTNADALFSHTGVDVRDQFLTFGIVAEEREHVAGRWGANYYDKIIHHDSEPIVGTYDRIHNIAKTWAKENGKVCYYAFITPGGGSSGQESPKKDRV